MQRALIVLGVVAMAAGQLQAGGQQGAPSEGRVQRGTRLKIERDLEYANVGGKTLLLDIYRPDPASAPTPVVVWIHGTKGGDPTRTTTPAAALATPGYAVASIDYRSDAGSPITAGVSDAKAAVRWLRANAARFNIDPAKVGVFGHDSGATIAAILGTAGDESALEGDSGTPGQSSRVQAVVALAGPVDRAQTGESARVCHQGRRADPDPARQCRHGGADAPEPGTGVGVEGRRGGCDTWTCRSACPTNSIGC